MAPRYTEQELSRCSTEDYLCHKIGEDPRVESYTRLAMLRVNQRSNTLLAERTM
ncbi:hypothetical protein STEG23_027793, partial [Scotinomys teguina]